MLIKGYTRWGNAWTKIAATIGGRTDNAVKNRFAALAEAVRLGGNARAHRNTPASAQCTSHL
jgi:hypothetical protein